MIRIKKKHIRGLILIMIGSFLIALYGIRFYARRVLSFHTANSPSAKVEVEKKLYAKPLSIEIASLKIVLPVAESGIVDGVWQISEKGASHLDTSANPGEGGNVVIYAHNKRVLFGPLRQIRKDAEITLVTEDGKSWNYKVVETVLVTPGDISFVTPRNAETLTLYTCAGFADSKRFIVIAKPVTL